MKKKLLSVLLVIVLIFTTVYIGIPTALASDGNLIINGDFSSYSGNNPTGWRFDLPATNSFSYEIVEDVQIPNGPTTNAIKFTSSETVETPSGGGGYQPLDSNGKDARMYFSSTNTAKIEKCATYTMTFWVKVKSLYGFSALMFEPDYVIPSLRRNINYALEGHNLYTYKTTSASLRNCRDDINHVWKVVSSGQILSSYPSSMFITRNNAYGDYNYSYQQVLTPDFPMCQREGEWVKVSQTFTTDNLAEHEADVAYTFRFPQVAGGEVWIADVQLTVQNQAVLFYYTPTINDETLGTVNKDIPVYDGKSIVINAQPFEGNTFEGWYLNDELVSEDEEYTFTYKSGDTLPNYEARFHKGIRHTIIPPGVNDYNLGSVSPVDKAYAYEGEEVTFTATPLDGNGFDGWYVGDQRISTSLNYKYKFDPEDTSLANVTAKFTAGPYAVPGASFEGLGYTNGQVLVTHTNGYIAANGETCDQSDLTNNGNWSVDTYHEGTWQQVSADTTFARTGTTSILLNCRNGWAGYTIKGLEPHTVYRLSFYAWAFDNKADTVNGFNQVIVTTAGERPIQKTTSGWTNRKRESALGGTPSLVDCRKGWTKTTTSFMTLESGDVTVWYNVIGDGTQNLHIDDIAVYQYVSVNAIGSLGGSITTNITEKEVIKGSYIELNAYPLEGNTFAGWYNIDSGELVSTNANYCFNIADSISLVAKFKGDNMPPTDILPLHGMDGTFEEGTVTGWWADDPVWGDDISWCRWQKSTEMAYEGNYSLKGYCRYRYTNLAFKNLAKNSDYCLTMYVNPTGAAQYDQTEYYTRIEEYGIIGPNERYLDGATDVLVRQGTLNGNNGWQKIELCFNTGNRTEVIFSAKLIGQNDAVCYYDNISLYQYNSTELLKNPGNVNGDENGEVTLDDVVALAQIVAGWNDVQHSEPHLDINGDGGVTLDDVVLLAQFVAGWEVELSEIAYKP